MGLGVKLKMAGDYRFIVAAQGMGLQIRWRGVVDGITDVFNGDNFGVFQWNLNTYQIYRLWEYQSRVASMWIGSYICLVFSVLVIERIYVLYMRMHSP